MLYPNRAETRIVAFLLIGKIDWLAQNELGEEAKRSYHIILLPSPYIRSFVYHQSGFIPGERDETAKPESRKA